MYFTAYVHDTGDVLHKTVEDRESILSKTRAFNGGKGGKVRAAIGSVNDNRSLLVLLYADFRLAGNVSALTKEFLESVGLSDVEIISIDEVCGSEFRKRCFSASEKGFISSPYEICSPYTETLENCDFASDYLSETDTVFDDDDPDSVDLHSELRRIASSAERPFCGHPAHYILMTDDCHLALRSADYIIKALEKKRRLLSRRVVSVRKNDSIDDDGNHSGFLDALENAYLDNRGGSVIIDAGKLGESGCFAVSPGDLASLVRENCEDVLTFLVFGSDDSLSLSSFLSYCDDIRFVKITEADVACDDVREYFERMLKRDSLEDYASLLFSSLPGEKRSYTSRELDKLYSSWKRDLFRKEIYPEYYSDDVSDKSTTGISGSSWKKLQGMPGLDGVKKLIGKMVTFSRYNAMRVAHAEKSIDVSGHMVFTGNPGTAKTTVARLLASILRENGVLSKGELIEVGRKDIVGRYAGWTARNVEDLFRKARGSVLFIDEAYSLIEDNDGSYGDEAVSAIVQLMENCRKDTLVIFAGYPERMGELLESNPGLRSRISYTVHFDDYTPFELWKILLSFSEEDGITVSADAMNTVMKICEEAMEGDSFGNGRFVRNLYDRARMNAAERIVGSGIWERMTLTAADFTSSEETENEEKKASGFGF